MQVIAIGIFGLKKIPLASSLTIPLPILTLIFNSYCRRRFLPSFKGYPAQVSRRFSFKGLPACSSSIHSSTVLFFFFFMMQCLINKDRLDEHDPTISSFYDKLSTAYQDPAFEPVRYSDHSETSSSPLLRGDRSY